MVFDITMIGPFMVLSALGSVTRALFGIYKAYTNTVYFKIDWKRVAIEIVASMFFGTFSAVILMDIGNLKATVNSIAMIAGFFGPDLILIVSKKVGLTKGIKVKVTQQQVELAEFNDRQIAAIQYLKTHERLTNEMYQKMNDIKRTTAKNDLSKLVRADKIKKKGHGKSTYYVAV